MALPSVEELCRLLIQLELVPQAVLDECRGQLGAQRNSIESVLAALEGRGLLTSYQAGKIRKNEARDLVLARYKLMYRNASGSFARVFRACDLRTGQMVGMKILRQRFALDPKAVAEFHREAELGKSLRHENIVPIFEVGEARGQHYFTMEFVEGGNLRDFITIRKKLSPAEATRCTLDMAEGLSYALGRGATHRDLKMTNVLMSSKGVAKLVDFGLAAVAEDEGSDLESAQRALEYATLEKNTGVPRDDPRSDLYFLGGIYYELLTGVPPLPRTRDRRERSQFSRYLDVKPIRQLEPALPRPVVAIVDKLMQLNPALRYQTPAEVVRDLKSAALELGPAAQGSRANGLPADSSRSTVVPGQPVRTLMCIESRPDQQDILREYFTRHGYRVLVLSDLERGLSRLESNPPDCMVIMADSLGAAALEGYDKAQDLVSPSRLGVILILGEAQSEWRERLRETHHARVLVKPVTLRELRGAIKACLNGELPPE